MTVFDQIKRNAVPAQMMRTAAKGALPVESQEMLEILVYLTRNPVFAQDAKTTLAQWDAVSAVEILADPSAPPEVLGYFWAEANRRPVLMPTLIENPAISENLLMELAATGRRDIAALLLSSPRARSSPAIAEALANNPNLTAEELQDLGYEAPLAPSPPAEASGDAESDAAAHQAWHHEHATEIAAEEDKPFALVGRDEDEDEDEPAQPSSAEPAPAQPAAASPDVATNLAAAALAAPARAKAPLDDKKMSVLQKISRMKAAERVKAAFSGGRDERMILIRDGAKVVQNAVLASPKLTEPEVETFAAAKNVSENVLREIARNRRFMKNYSVVRNLVNNPKCPLDLSLTLIKNLLVYDLKQLRSNKSVPDTIRQLAFKLYREKSGPAREGKRS